MGELRSRSELRRDTKSEGIGALHPEEGSGHSSVEAFGPKAELFQAECLNDQITTSRLPSSEKTELPE